MSAFIYLAYFNASLNPIILKILCTFSFLVGLMAFLKTQRGFLMGLCIGFLWFYWVGFSFKYYNLGYLAPLAWVSFGLMYGVFFWAACYFSNPIWRIGVLSVMSFVHPFGFNWFIPELALLDSFFLVSKVTLILFCLLALSLLQHSKQIRLIGSLACIAGLLFFIAPTPNPTKLPLKIKTTNTQVPQQTRWDSGYLEGILQNNFKLINEAIDGGYEVVVLPETAFPLALNEEVVLQELLREQSFSITIITGALRLEGDRVFNSSYVFSNGDMQILDKQILVPFGEFIPLPSFLVSWINETFLGGRGDFSVSSDAENPNSIDLVGNNFRLAICYEATREEFYKNNPPFLIAISNNAWFTPSIEPILQKLLMRYFSQKYHTVVIHSANGSSDFIVP